MARIVTHYVVSHTIGGDSDIILFYQGGGQESLNNIPLAEAAYIGQLLRTEKPFTYDPQQRRLSTRNPEPAGEEE